MEILRSPREIAEMRKAGLLVWEAHQIAREMVRPGATTGEIDAAIEQYFLSQNAVPLFKGVPGPVPFPAVTCCSVNEEVVHGIPGPRELVEGDVLSLDTGCRLNGWCGDAATTLPVGQVDPEIERLLNVTRGTLELAVEKMGTCSRWSQVCSRNGTICQRSSVFPWWKRLLVMGIGREMHEDPQVPNFVSSQLRRGGDFDLVPGLVIAVEPMVNMGTKRVRTKSDHWTQVTADGKPSAHFEHTIAVTESGPEVLTGGPNGESW